MLERGPDPVRVLLADDVHRDERVFDGVGGGGCEIELLDRGRAR